MGAEQSRQDSINDEPSTTNRPVSETNSSRKRSASPEGQQEGNSAKRIRTEDSRTSSLCVDTMNHPPSTEEENVDLAALQNDLEEVERGLNERRGLLFSGIGASHHSSHSNPQAGHGGGRALFESIGSALGNIRERFQALTGTSTGTPENVNPREESTTQATTQPAEATTNDPPVLNESLRVLSERLETAERSHSTRIPLNVLQSEISRRDLTSEGTPSRMQESFSSLGGDNEDDSSFVGRTMTGSSPSRPSLSRRRSSILMASRTRDDLSSSRTMEAAPAPSEPQQPSSRQRPSLRRATLAESSRNLVASAAGLATVREQRSFLEELPGDIEGDKGPDNRDDASGLLLPDSAQKRIGEDAKSLRASTRGSLRVLSEDLLDRFASLEDEDDDSGEGLYAWGTLEFQNDRAESEAAYRFFGTNTESSTSALSKPQKVPSETRLGRSTITSVSASETHCAFVTASGRLLICGNNEKGAVDPSQRDVTTLPRPAHLEAGLSLQRIKRVSCGRHHTAVVTETRSVLSWGSNDRGQLGHRRAPRTPEQSYVFPKAFVLGNGGKRAVDVSCYDGHTVVLTTRMEIFLCGGVLENSLPPGGKDDDDEHKFFPLPQEILSLKGLPIVGIASGDSHAVAWTAHGTAYAWGSNHVGQCGREYPRNLGVPVPVGVPKSQLQPYPGQAILASSLLVNWNFWMKGEPISLAHDVHVVDAACGKDHTVFVTESGKLLVCGSNALGQLGSSQGQDKESFSNTKWVNHPKPENRFTNVEAGANHTILLDDSGSLWQMGNGDCSIQNLPSKYAICSIAAGGSINFAMTESQENAIDCSALSVSSMPSLDDLMETIRLEKDSCDGVGNKSSVDDLSRRAEELFRSPAVMNSLFMDPDEIDKIYETLISGSGNKEVQQRMVTSIERGMTMGLNSMDESRLMHFESVRFLLLYLQCPLWRDEDHTIESAEKENETKLRFDTRGDLLFLLCETILTLPFEGYRAFLACTAHVYGKDRFVPFLVKPLVHQLNERLVRNITHGVPLIASVLSWLSKVNERFDRTLARLEDFHCSGIDDMQMEALFEDLAAYHMASESEQSSNFFLAAHPFLMTPSVKEKLLQVESQMSMVHAAREEGVSFDERTREFKFQPYFVLAIDRKHLLPQTLQAVAKASTRELRKGLKVVFKGEDGVDAGGVTKEFFQLLCEKLFDVNTGMWSTSADTNETWFNPDCTWNGEGFYLVGVLCGLAVYNSVILDVHFPHALYRKLLALPLGLEDVIDADVRKGLKSLLDYDGDDAEYIFCLNFEVSWMDLGQERKRELKPGGADIPVTSENKEEYVMLYVKWLLVDSIAPQYDEFERGFNQVMRDSSLDILTAEELELLVTGTPELDFVALAESCNYEGGFDAESAVVKNIWKWVQSAPLPTQEKFLKFCTGSSKGPIGGLGKMPFLIQRAGPDSPQLPTAHTCFNTLIVPDYGDDYEKLSNRLGRAIIECEGFGLQ